MFIIIILLTEETVSKALTGGSEVEETAQLAEKMDKFFDCLYVHNYTHMAIRNESLSKIRTGQEGIHV